ncbi:homeobox-containing protein 1-like isoform X3 [Anguilla anguilla]|uniref:homeobox-containing protein 1-like isoform X3 n=1 Tax=Anguilla anguilla TaxID=7936 RepID=UPI0015B206B9|nr:homeobox-containing protein 1-like isoform X3 [Anguilla anguilla]
MSHYTDEPRFTIEQIDLLQRLRHTGMTKREILHALDTLERLDREHGEKFGHRAAYAAGPRAPGGPAAGGGSAPAALSSSSSNGAPAASSSTATATAATQTQYRSSLSPSPTNGYDASPPAPAPSSAAAAVVAAQNGRDALSAVPNGKLSPPRFPGSSGVGVGPVVPARAYTYDVADEEIEIDDKVEELMRRDSNLIKEEIKAFLANRRISQAVVAQVTGISQSRISHWLLQQGSDLSEQKKRAFFRWYQLEKTSPGATLSMRPTPLALEEMEWMQTPPPISSAPGSFRLRRGSRFTWRKECLAVMESYFNENQYPDEAKREEIANACNAVIQKPGKKLTELERVTSLKVYNWFANRRKEIKRRANIAILESHGIDVQSPGGHSNSDDVDGNDYSEQACDAVFFEKRPFPRPRFDLSPPTQVPVLPPSWLAARPSLGSAGPQRAPPAGRPGAGPGKAEGGPRLTAVSWSPPSLQDDSNSHGEHQDPITLAVEMAAVNHSILALAQQGGAGGEIKTEVLDDD